MTASGGLPRRCCAPSFGYLIRRAKAFYSTSCISPRRLLFLGGDCFSLGILEGLHQYYMDTSIPKPFEGHSPIEVLCPQRTKLTARGQHCGGCGPTSPENPLPPPTDGWKSPLVGFCAKHGVPCHVLSSSSDLHPSQFSGVVGFGNNDEEASRRYLRQFDVAVVASFRFIIPSSFVAILPPTVNVHPSLLPKHRGAAPIHATMLHGDTEGGASIIKITGREHTDCGDVLSERRIPISPTADFRTYFPEVLSCARSLLIDTLFGGDFSARWSAAVPQGDCSVSPANDPNMTHKFSRGVARVQWECQSALELYYLWRAYVNDAPLYCMLNRMATPLAGRIRNESKRVVRVILNEVAHPNIGASVELQSELGGLAARPSVLLAPGTAYFPRCDCSVLAVWCGGWGVAPVQKADTTEWQPTNRGDGVPRDPDAPRDPVPERLCHRTSSFQHPTSFTSFSCLASHHFILQQRGKKR